MCSSRVSVVNVVCVFCLFFSKCSHSRNREDPIHNITGYLHISPKTRFIDLIDAEPSLIQHFNEHFKTNFKNISNYSHKNNDFRAFCEPFKNVSNQHYNSIGIQINQIKESQISQLFSPIFKSKVFKCIFETESQKNSSWEEWIYTFLAVTLISLIGLFCVFLIPLMKKSLYHVLIQFLIATGVGSLIGDAFLHLIPHALFSDKNSHNSYSADQDNDSLIIVKCFFGLFGILVFFLAERLVIISQIHRAFTKQLKSRSAEKECNNNETSAQAVNTSVESKIFYETVQDLNKGENGDFKNRASKKHKLGWGCSGHKRKNNFKKMSSDFTNCPPSQICNQPGMMQTNLLCSDPMDEHACLNEAVPGARMKQVLLDMDSNSHELRLSVDDTSSEARPHGHHHGHSHDLSSVSSIALAIIAGDGLHNFCDGIAIGAAFASNLRDGMAVAITVLCHELPHELGDFAVLLRAGLDVKMAIFYNIMSSVLCYIGAVIGIVLGNNTELISWVYMFTAGMFLYIALVDMAPELTTLKIPDLSLFSNPMLMLFVHVLGISLGVGILFLITIFDSHS